jgi:hypothetical protein
MKEMINLADRHEPFLLNLGAAVGRRIHPAAILWK